MLVTAGVVMVVVVVVVVDMAMVVAMLVVVVGVGHAPPRGFPWHRRRGEEERPAGRRPAVTSPPRKDPLRCSGDSDGRSSGSPDGARPSRPGKGQWHRGAPRPPAQGARAGSQRRVRSGFTPDSLFISLRRTIRRKASRWCHALSKPKVVLPARQRARNRPRLARPRGSCRNSGAWACSPKRTRARDNAACPCSHPGAPVTAFAASAAKAARRLPQRRHSARRRPCRRFWPCGWRE